VPEKRLKKTLAQKSEEMELMCMFGNEMTEISETMMGEPQIVRLREGGLVLEILLISEQCFQDLMLIRFM